MWKSGHNLRERVLRDAGPKTLTKQKVFAGELGPGHTLGLIEPFYYSLLLLLLQLVRFTSSFFSEEEEEEGEACKEGGKPVTCPVMRAVADQGKPRSLPLFASFHPFHLFLLLSRGRCHCQLAASCEGRLG